jgi:nucleoside-diphosphate-sugar epimerase
MAGTWGNVFMNKNILITGATGYIGQRVAERILNDKLSSSVTLWIHAKTQTQLDSKSEKIKSIFSGYESRVTICGGALEDENPFSTVDWNSITGVIHSAALTNFNVKEEDANAVNRDGSLKLLAAARQAKNLEKFTYISTVYASGLKAGEVPETYLTNEFGFSNHYERSKWEVEEKIRTEFNDLPWEISRVATIVCDNVEGTVIQHNAVHNTLKLMYYGLISLVPGFPETPVYLVTGEETAEAIHHLHVNAPVRQFFNISHDEASSMKLGALIDEAYNTFMEDQAFKNRRILKPLFTDQKAFDALVEGVQGFGGQVLAQAVTSIAPFGKQLFIRKEMLNSNMRQNFTGFTDFNAEEVIKHTCIYLMKTNFKKG